MEVQDGAKQEGRMLFLRLLASTAVVTIHACDLIKTAPVFIGFPKLNERCTACGNKILLKRETLVMTNENRIK